MLALILTLIRFFSVVRSSMGDAEFRGLTYLVVILLGGGTVFYHHVEGWAWVDSFYFCAITLSTVGYGDLSPTVPVSKLFTAVYVLVGVGVLVAFGTRLVTMAAVQPSIEGGLFKKLKGLSEHRPDSRTGPNGR